MKVKPLNKLALKKMHAAGQLAASVLDFITPHVKVGVSTEKLNQLCHEFTLKHGGISAPLNYKGFPKSICTSINDVVCHGIPSETEILKNGDIMNIDVTVILDGYHGDTSRMFWAGDVSDTAKKLTQTTYDCMMAGINTIHSGSKLSDIGKAIEPLAKKENYGVVREYCGHGIGKIFHTEPMVLHYDYKNPGHDLKFRAGHTFTVEPMINMGGQWQTKLLDDNWTVKTQDGDLSAQFEHTLSVTENGVEIHTLSPEGFTCPPYK